MKAIKIFTDRIEPMLKIKDETEILINNESFKKMVNFYGIGGIGKTRFMNEFRNLLEDYEIVEKAMVSLDSYEINYPVKVLVNLRKQLKQFDFVKFDYALTQYYSKIHMPTSKIIDELTTIKSQFVDVYKELGDNALETFVPYYSSLKKLFKNGKKLIKLNNYRKYEEVFQEYEQMTTMDLFMNLPRIFSETLNQINKPLVFLLDDYDSYLRKVKEKSISVNAESWLYDIYKQTNRILFVIASRDKITNFESYDITLQEIESIHLSNLTKKDIRSYLVTVPINNENIINTIIESSKGVPLYLDLFVNHYIYNQTDFTDDCEFKAPRLKGLITRYLSYLSDAEKEMVLYLSAFNRIDETFIRYIRHEKNVQISDINLKELLDCTLFIDEDLFLKVDFTLRDHIRESDQAIPSSISVELLMNYVVNEIDASNYSYEFYLHQLIEFFAEYKQIQTNHIENWLRIINEIGDRTYFEPFDDMFEMSFSKRSPEHDAIYTYYRLLKTRRTGHVQEGKQIMDSLKENGFDFDIYGNMKESLRLLDVFFIHLTGHYKEALEGYQEIIDDHRMSDTLEHDNRTLINALYKYGDLLFLYGKFKQSKEVLFGINIDDQLSNASKYEVIRTRAHIYRLNYLTEKANKAYMKILDSKDKTDYRIIANTTTSVAENLQFFNPEAAITYAEDAIYKNKLINSNMEVGKAYAAKSIAHSMLKEYKKATQCYQKAIEIQEQTGYRSGILFGLIAKFIVLFYTKGQSDPSVEECVNDIKHMWGKLTVYKSFGIIIEILMDVKLEETQNIDWLDYETTYNNLSKALKRN